MADFNYYRFSSKEIHPGSGTYSYGYRFYDPNLQRWLNRDPIGIAGGINAYGFGGNSPETYVDTDGRFLLPAALIGAGLGAIGNGIYAYINDQDIGQAMLRGALIGGIAGATAGIGMEAALAAAGVQAATASALQVGAAAGLGGMLGDAAGQTAEMALGWRCSYNPYQTMAAGAVSFGVGAGTAAALGSGKGGSGGPRTCLVPKSGRRGNQTTGNQIDQVRDQFLNANQDYRHVAGGTDRVTGATVPEEYIPGPGGGVRAVHIPI